LTKREKIIKRLKSTPNDFSYIELVNLLSGFGYIQIKKGKSAGSRRAFINEISGHIIRLHKPHPGNSLKKYQILQLLDELKKENLI